MILLKQLLKTEHKLTLLSTTRLSQRNWFIMRRGMLTPRPDLELLTKQTQRIPCLNNQAKEL